jgi:hypothetical protein
MSLRTPSSLFASSFVIVFSAVLAGCPPTPPGVDLDAGPDEDPDAGPGGCRPVELGPVTFNFQDDVSTHYQAELITELDTPTPDYLVLQFFNINERIGDFGVGTFALDDAVNGNYGGPCAECLLVFADQATENATPTRTYFQSAGSIELSENPRETRNLFGRITGLQLVESTIGGPALESEPVPGGECLDIGTVELDLRFVDPEWTCDDADYNAGDGVCQCDICGAPDPDCFADFGEPPPTTIEGCDPGDICDFFGCVKTCDAFGGVGCDVGVCQVNVPEDRCVTDATAVTNVPVGQRCLDENAYLCAVAGGIATGLCDFDADFDGERFCRPICQLDADCDEAAGEVCLSFVVADDGTIKGFCDQPLPEPAP